jgi:hypothetical protein
MNDPHGLRARIDSAQVVVVELEGCSHAALFVGLRSSWNARLCAVADLAIIAKRIATTRQARWRQFSFPFTDDLAFALTDDLAFALTDDLAFALTDDLAFALTNDNLAFALTDDLAFALTDDLAFPFTDDLAFPFTDELAFPFTNYELAFPFPDDELAFPFPDDVQWIGTVAPMNKRHDKKEVPAHVDRQPCTGGARNRVGYASGSNTVTEPFTIETTFATASRTIFNPVSSPRRG